MNLDFQDGVSKLASQPIQVLKQLLGNLALLKNVTHHTPFQLPLFKNQLPRAVMRESLVQDQLQRHGTRA